MPLMRKHQYAQADVSHKQHDRKNHPGFSWARGHGLLWTEPRSGLLRGARFVLWQNLLMVVATPEVMVTR